MGSRWHAAGLVIDVLGHDALTVAGQLVRKASGLGLVAVLVVGCQAGSQPTPSVSPQPSITARPSPSAAPEPSLSPSPTSTPEPPQGIAPDDVVMTIVEGLTVRRSAGTDGERVGFLSLGAIAFVVAGPVDVDGVPWYLLTGEGLPYASGCSTPPADQPISCPAWAGWAAGANAGGEPWLEETSFQRCPSGKPTIERMSEAGFTLRLMCWDDQELTFRAWWPTIPDDAGLGGACQSEDLAAGWLICQGTNYNGLSASEEEGFTQRLTLSIDPASDVVMPERGTWVEVVGHFDDPASSQCAEATGEGSFGPELTVFYCRIQFVPTSVTAVSGP